MFQADRRGSRAIERYSRRIWVSLTARGRTFRDMTNVAHVLTDAEFAALLEAGPNALVVTDVPGSVLLVNAQAEKLFGYDRKELIGKAIEMLIPERYRSLRPIGAGRKLHGLRKDGSEFSVEISLTPFRSGNRLWVFAATGRCGDGRCGTWSRPY